MKQMNTFFAVVTAALVSRQMNKSVRTRIKLILISLLLLIILSNVYAITTTISCTSASGVNSAISSSSNGDVLQCTGSGWSSGTVTMPTSKGITLDGNGAIVNGGSLTIGSSPYQNRVTNFKFTNIPEGGISADGTLTSQPWRIDHCSFASNNHHVINVGDYATGVIDHSLITLSLTNHEFIANWGWGPDVTTGWTNPQPPGSQAALYLEDNTINGLSGSTADCLMQNYYAARTVVRYNNISNAMIEAHGNYPYSTRWMEIYKNKFSGSDLDICLRGGSGIVFGNNNPSSRFVEEVNDCNAGTAGCDEVGKGQNWMQYPLYWWDNGGADPTLNEIGCAPAIPGAVVSGLDVISTVGSGTMLPSTCTLYDAYWKSDAGGNWDNTNGAANDGVLYKCDSNGDWQLYYAPLSYPHPSTRETGSCSNCHYVSSGAAGANNGNDWANAWTALPATLQRGHTYYIADGSYGGYTFDDAVSGSQYITIRKATVVDHGTSIGWQDSYGDGEAVFTSTGTVWNLAPGAKYYHVDGQVGDGKEGYGIRLFSTAGRDSSTALVRTDTSGTYADTGDHSNIIIEHVEFDWNNGKPAGACGDAEAIALRAAHPSSNIVISHCYIHHASGGAMYFDGGSNYVINDSYFYDMGDETAGGDCPGSSGHKHWEIFWFTNINNITFSNNVLENAYPNGLTGWVMFGETKDAKVYNNVFFCSRPCSSGGNGVIASWTANTNNNVYIYHNTFADLNGGRFLFENGAGFNGRNNLYFNQEFDCSLEDQSHAACGGGQQCCGTNQQTAIDSAIFSNYNGDDFRLSRPTDPGINLGALYRFDKQGNLRVDWDRGAYEFASGSCVPSTEVCGNSIDEDCNGADLPCSCHVADTNSDGVVSITELNAYINSWLSGQVTIASLMDAIRMWKAGCA
jgi:hypothetical protein